MIRQPLSEELNEHAGALIDVEGEAGAVAEFVSALGGRSPTLARIEAVDTKLSIIWGSALSTLFASSNPPLDFEVDIAFITFPVEGRV